MTIGAAGLDKLPTPDWMVEQVVALKLFPAPAFFAFAASFTEFVGGVLLLLGLLTRASCALLALTLGVAAFGYHAVAPITGMHIAQGYFWMFVAFLAVGPGCWSLDHMLRSRVLMPVAGRPRPLVAVGLAVTVLVVLSAFGIRRELSPGKPQAATVGQTAMESVSVAGSFNQWSLAATPMTRREGAIWTAEVMMPEAGPIEFKFAANGSWTMNLGDNDQRDAGLPVAGTGEPGGGNIRAYVPAPGTYRISVNSETLAYELAQTGSP